MKVSFCIPSLNRKELLCNTIKSICDNESFKGDFELCVYNNCSDEPYTEVESLITSLSDNYVIRYTRGLARLNIDESMFEAIRYAEGEFLFLIGDDDYLSEGGLSKIVELIDATDFDLAIFNANLINEDTKQQSKLFNSVGKIRYDLKEALLELKIYCTYGNLLVKRKHFKENDFRLLVGTSHAYGCYWLEFFRNFENDIQPIIIVPEENVVNLRVVQKNYKLLDVMFKHIDLEFKLFDTIIGDKSKEIFGVFKSSYWKRHLSYKQLISYELNDHYIYNIKFLNGGIYNMYFYRIWIAIIVGKFIKPIKTPLKCIFRMFK